MVSIVLRAVRTICLTCRSLVRLLWSFVCRWYPRLGGHVCARLGWRKAGGEGNDGVIHRDDELLPHDSSREAEVGPPAPAAAESDVRDDRDVSDDGEDLRGCRADTSDDLYCGYDSTWEDKDHQRSGGIRRPAPTSNYMFRRFQAAARDMQNYRRGYPSIGHSHNGRQNLEFYLGKRTSVPDYMYIQDFHNWHENYDALESVHTYIQWLFPLQEPGMNSSASTLTQEEIEEFLKNDTAKANLLKSYKLMLNFYGIRLRDEKTGDVERAANWRQRFDNLNSHTHNSLRITRILKCLGTLGFPHYQYPLVLFFLKETLQNNNLPRIKDSVLNYFMFAVLDKMQRRHLIRFAYSAYEPKDDFVWCPKNIQRRLSSSRKQIRSTNHLDDENCDIQWAAPLPSADGGHT